jgi:hypothetical protein
MNDDAKVLADKATPVGGFPISSEPATFCLFQEQAVRKPDNSFAERRRMNLV